ncbi:hypothetical protein [Emticicia sp. TH156]|uniref:hypothetical protein n=1 Tax=Emticicia sp. TH156 TaxID=2067454 RepID=UPI000C784A71|nr:hypothetical protein [Emticicia sp. TH156]PLK44313.1 hypothetical protein C0V77_11000 [Emticicia sp. TH156]
MVLDTFLWLLVFKIHNPISAEYTFNQRIISHSLNDSIAYELNSWLPPLTLKSMPNPAGNPGYETLGFVFQAGKDRRHGMAKKALKPLLPPDKFTANKGKARLIFFSLPAGFCLGFLLILSQLLSAQPFKATPPSGCVYTLRYGTER